MKRPGIIFLVLIGIGASISLAMGGCSSSGTSATPAASSGVVSFPVGFAVGSLTNAASTAAGLRAKASAGPSKQTISASDTIEDKVAALELVAEASTASACQVTLTDITTNAPAVSCYGPNLAYINHPEGTADGDDTYSGGINGGSDMSDGVLPGGDLGLWSATVTDGTACAAAKINADIQGINYKVDNALLLSAAMSCVLRAAGQSLPAVGSSVDLTSAFSTAVTANNPTATISSATIARESDSGSNAVYLYTISGTLNSKTVTINLKHSPQNSDNTQYVGRLWTAVSGSQSSGFSVSYEKTASKVLFKMTSSNFPNNETSTNMFNTDGTFKLNGTWNGNIALTKAELDSTTFLGKFSYAWQAGTGDSHARVFNAYTASSGGADLGYAFFGFGQNFSNSGAGQASDAAISTFICNWAGPGGSHNAATGVGKAQKQYLKFVTDKWVPNPDVADPNKLDYAPVTTCSRTANQADTNGRVFDYTTSYTSTFPSSWPGTTSAVTHELVTLATDTEYAGFSQPTAPTEL